jgi:carbonic anhydrase
MSSTTPQDQVPQPHSFSVESIEEMLPTSAAVSRRKFLGATAASFLAAASLDFLPAATPLYAQSVLTPDEALKELMDGNERFSSGRMTSFEHDLKILKEHTVDKQEPFAAVLSCADSRVPVELIFDQTIGHVFVARVAGNIITPEIIASLEYGAAVLGNKVILVLGHAGCGAVKAAIQGKDVPGQISALFPHIQPAIDEAGSDLAAATKANASIQARLLRESSPVIGPLVKENKLRVVAGVYDIATGKVTLA